MDKRSKHSYKEKLRAVKLILAGQATSRSIARELGGGLTTVKRWLKQYANHGADGLKFKNGSYEGRFKVQVVRYMLRKELSLVETAVHFKIPNESAVARWLKMYEQHGAASLLKEMRGRKKRGMSKKAKKITAEPGSPEEKLAALQRENEYLRAENALLKKLEALIQQEKAEKRQAKRQKPSGN